MSTMSAFATRRRAYFFMLNKLRLPRPFVTGLVKGVAAALSPAAQKRRRIAGDPPKALAVAEADGHRVFAPHEIPSAGPAAAALAARFEKLQADGRLANEAAKKPFLMSVVPDQTELLTDPAVRDFVLSDEMIDTALRYFGATPILTELHLLWSPPNETLLKSQLYHFDTEDDRQLKVFLNVFDVTPECGPFTLLSAETSREVSRATKYVGGRRARLGDEAIEQTAAGKEVRVMGPAGGGVIVDTSRCLHYGSRGNRSQRLVLMLQFMSVNAPKIDPTDWSPAAPALGPLDETRRLVLQL